LSLSPEIEKARRFINENYAQGFQIASLAKKLGLSYHHLCRKYKRETGETIGNHVARLRVGRAKELLVRSSLSVGDVSKECGYQSKVQFHRMFERLAGDTPMQYRKKAFSV
jgi:two-component system response regulator YesN